jgi:hypothetical protein
LRSRHAAKDGTRAVLVRCSAPGPAVAGDPGAKEEGRDLATAPQVEMGRCLALDQSTATVAAITPVYVPGVSF